MFTNDMELILASGSPRRRRFLEELGLRFEVHVADVDETVQTGENPENFVKRLSLEKAHYVSRQHPEAWVIGADTAVVLDGDILGKPEGPEDAVAMLIRLSGRTHEVWTGFTVFREIDRIGVTRSVCTEVAFVDAPVDILKAYVGTGEPLDKAGAYGIQGRGGMLVKRIDGSYSNVVGLPMAELTVELFRHGAIVVSA